MSDTKQSLEEMFVNTILKESAGKLEGAVQERIDEIQKTLTEKVSKLQSKFELKINTLDEEISSAPITVNLGTVAKPKHKIVHRQFNKLLNILKSTKRIQKNIMLVGPAGSGKSTLCGQVADALKVQFYPMSVGLQTTKSDLIGFINAKGDYVTTPLREAYEKGGLVLLDEFDAAHAGVVTILNSLLANDFCSFPDKIVYKHQDFVCLVACNTYGKGGSVDYVGRNRLDGATLDRFICVDVDYDKTLENKLTSNKEWVKVVRRIRRNIHEYGLKVIVSPRASMQGADLLDAGFDIEEVLSMVIFKGVSEDIRSKLIKGVDFGPFAKDGTEPEPVQQAQDPIVTIGGARFTINQMEPITITPTPTPTSTITCSINFDTKHAVLSNIKSDVNIIADADWAGEFSLYLSSGRSWSPSVGQDQKSMFLNYGDSFFTGKSDEYILNAGRKLVKELDKHSESIKIENGQALTLTVTVDGIHYSWDID